MTKNGANKQQRVEKSDELTKKKAEVAKQSAPEKKATTAPAPAVAAAAANGKAVKDVAIEQGKKPAKSKSADTTASATKEKTKKAKLVRDSFTMPEAEYKLIADVKRDCLQAGIEVKKSELLRVGVALVRQMEVGKLKAALSALPALKAGRPKKEK